MFEYLMPQLLMEPPPDTLLAEAAEACVREHIQWGADHGTPWGVSESAYNVRDFEGTYQYQGFGVPDLALKRTLISLVWARATGT